MKSIKERVIAMTGITEDEYTNALLDGGREFLVGYNMGNEHGVSLLISTPEFWKWYNDVWEMTDDIFIAFFFDSNYTAKELRERWYARHSPERISCTFGYDVLDAGYAKMFDAVAHKKNNA